MSPTICDCVFFGGQPRKVRDQLRLGCFICPFLRSCAEKTRAAECRGESPINFDAVTASEAPPAPSALATQVAGGHYKDKKIQPVEYIHANGLNFLEGCIVKRITRWRDKPAAHRFQDLEKIKHEIDLLIELETKHG